MIPILNAPRGSASAWVGIDGDSCQSGLLQTGVDFDYHGDSFSYSPWYEWYPADSVYFNDISFNPGDVIRLSVIATSTTSGTATIENLTSGGQPASANFSYPQYPLCGQDAEWIVEPNDTLTLTDFGNITFTSATATKSDGSSVSPNGAQMSEITANGNTLTSVTETADGVMIQYLNIGR